MLSTLWNDFLYQPLFNFLIWVYNNWTDMNFGWAVVYLTIILRLVLLPFTLVSERNRVRNAELADDLRNLAKEYKNDPVRQKEEIRKVMRKRKVQPWAKIVVLGIQVLVLILLYQVFLRGITGEKILKILYPAVEFPGVINLNFYGFDLGERNNLIWPAAVALWLFLETYFEYRHREAMGLKKGDLMFLLLFPASVFIILWYLPMVKSLFILTSMVFSLIIGYVSKALFKSSAGHGTEHH
jgi:YidC/Oxa1 family membrane protein insertase